MPTYTTTYSLGKPVVGADEDAWGDTLNASLDSIDDILDGTTPITGIDINSGTIDNVVIGGATPAAGTFTTLTANTSITGTLATAAQTNITSVGTLTGLTVSASASLAGASTSADITFGDNDKAIFGAGSDLQIYHDGSNSYIEDSGTGSLLLRGNNVSIQNAAGTENVAQFIEDGFVKLFYDNASKLATTATGVDITGTLTSDGLTVGGSTNNAQYANLSSSGLRALRLSSFANNGNDNAGHDINATSSFGAITLSTGGNTRFKADAGGDISFYEDTGTTAKFFWDASEEELTIADGVSFYNDGSAGVVAAEAGYDLELRSRSGQNVQIVSGGSEVIRIDSSGNVGIGTSSPSQALHVNSGTTDTAALFQSSDSQAYIAWEDNTSSTPFRAGVLGDNFILGTSSNERMRIDSSGNLLVGKTSTAFGTAGNRMLPDGGIYGTKDGAAPFAANRLTSDGDIMSFWKDTTQVGSIGSRSGNNLFIETPSSGRFKIGGSERYGWNNDSFFPVNDASRDLGYSSLRFKDLYLSGGVYLGGTDADHKLDYFEKGSTTVSLRGATEPATLITATMYWRRIDDQVFFQVGFEQIDTTGYSGAMSITSLPFANTSGSRAMVHAGLYNSGTWTDTLMGVIGTSSTTIEFQNLRSGNTWQAVNHSAGTNRYIWVTGSYMN